MLPILKSLIFQCIKFQTWEKFSLPVCDQPKFHFIITRRIDQRSPGKFL